MPDPKTNMEMQRQDRLQALDLLVGIWTTRGVTIATENEPAVGFSGTDSYEWIEGGHFLLHRVDVEMGGTPVVGVEIIGYDASSGAYRTSFMDVAGNATAYEARLVGREWTMASATDRFAGTFAIYGKSMAGRWQRKRANGDWAPWMDMTLTKP